MGDIADAIINGDFDSITGEWLGEGEGFPRTFAYNERHYTNGNKRNGAKKWMVKNGFSNFPKVAKAYCEETFPKKNYSSEKKLLVCGENFKEFSRWALSNKERLLKL